MLDPVAIPTTEEAAAFWLTNSFEQRKMLVHRREDEVRYHQRERNAQPEGAGPIAATAPTENRDVGNSTTTCPGDARRGRYSRGASGISTASLAILFGSISILTLWAQSTRCSRPPR